MAALEPSSSQNLDLADWPVWRSATGKNGSGGDSDLVTNITSLNGRYGDWLFEADE